MAYTINKLAKMAGVSVRTLHYYDEIGLLKPQSVAENGYRQYGRDELLRLQQILFFRELNVPLGKIREAMESPEYDMEKVLEQQRALLTEERDRLDAILKTISTTITSLKESVPMHDEALYGGLTRQKLEEYQKEAKERWGNTEAYKQSAERTKNYTKEDYAKLAEDGERATRALADAMDKGHDSPEVQSLIDDAYRLINERFYDCSIEMFRNLAVMTTQDERFAAYYRKFDQDLPEFRLKAVEHYCNAHS